MLWVRIIPNYTHISVTRKGFAIVDQLSGLFRARTQPKRSQDFDSCVRRRAALQLIPRHLGQRCKLFVSSCSGTKCSYVLTATSDWWHLARRKKHASPEKKGVKSRGFLAEQVPEGWDVHGEVDGKRSNNSIRGHARRYVD